MSNICTKQKDENSCNSLKFKGVQRCNYENKWFSYIRGGNCFIDKNLVEHVLDNLHPFIDINWETMKLLTLPSMDDMLPNPDNLNKNEMIDILHDLSYHIRSVFKEQDILTVLKERHGDLNNLSEQQLLYYVYLFSFIVYVSQFLSSVDFQSLLRGKNIEILKNMINSQPSKDNLLKFIKFFFSILPKKRTRKSIGWKNALLSGVIFSMILTGFIPAGVLFNIILMATKDGKIYNANLFGEEKVGKEIYEKDLINYERYFTPNVLNELKTFQTTTVTPKDSLEILVDADDKDINLFLKRNKEYKNIFPYLMQSVKDRKARALFSMINASQMSSVTDEEYGQLMLNFIDSFKNTIMLDWENDQAELYILYKFWKNGGKNLNIDYKKYEPYLDQILKRGANFEKKYNL